MNQTFSAARFGRLLRKFLRDNGWGLLSMVGVLFVILAVSMSFMVYKNPPNSVEGSRLIGFLALSLVLWPLFTHQIAADYNNREQALTALMLPASLFEKWLLLWVVTGLGFVLCFFSFFWLIDAVGTYYVNHREWPQVTLDYFKQRHISRTIDRVDFTELIKTPIWAVWLLLHPFTLAATLLFRKYTLAIGVFVGVLIFGAVFSLNESYIQLMLGESVEVVNAFPFTGFWVMKETASGPSHLLALPQPISNIIRWSVGVAAVVILYAVAYFRLKEREV